jgi:ParB-like chromosome segregation protein Spo0J
MSETVTVPWISLVFDREVWPRDQSDLDRVEMFKGLIEAGEHVPPPEVVDVGGGRWLIADGVHRLAAHQGLGHDDVEVIVVARRPDETPHQAAYRRALETATRSALPLTTAERRRAVERLLDERPDLSHRAIAKLVGVAHQTVDRWAVERGRADAEDASTEAVPERRVTVDDVARRLVRYTDQLNDARGFLDLVADGRMGKHLAKAFTAKFGDNAPAQAKRCAEWFAAAARRLDEEGST